MGARSKARPAWGLGALATVGLALAPGACGGTLDTQVGDGGMSAGANGGTHRDASTGSPAATSTAPTPTYTFGNPPPPNGTVTYDAGCSTSIAALGATLGACWGCAAMGCASELNACAADCVCNTTVAQALECVQNGGSSLPCFMPILMGSDDALAALTPCLLQASGECNCPLGGSTLDAGPAPAPDDASTACVVSGGGGTAGSGECSSTVDETCGGADYQVVCSCPRGSCVCFGPTTTVVSFDGCPYCPGLGPGDPGPLSNSQVLDLCGFPH